MTRDELAKSIAAAALLRAPEGKPFVLRSGRTSNYYLDKYLFSTRPEVLRELGAMFAERIRSIAASNPSPQRGEDVAKRQERGSHGGALRLAGAELGGIPLVTAASLATGLPCVFVRNAKKDYGTAKQLEGALHPGDRVILLEDVATTAGQALEAVSVLKSAGADVIAVIATIDRQEDAAENMAKAGVPFEALFTKRDLGISE